MICNKNEWKTLDELQAILYKFSKGFTEKEKATYNNFIFLCAKSTEEEKQRRAKTAAAIAERRKINKNYARPKKKN